MKASDYSSAEEWRRAGLRNKRKDPAVKASIKEGKAYAAEARARHDDLNDKYVSYLKSAIAKSSADNDATEASDAAAKAASGGAAPRIDATSAAALGASLHVGPPRHSTETTHGFRKIDPSEPIVVGNPATFGARLEFQHQGAKGDHNTEPIPDTGSSGPPSDRVVFLANEASYRDHPPRTLSDGWELVRYTPTLKVYKRVRSVLLAVRGTSDALDNGTWKTIALSTLASHKRYRNDLAFVKIIMAAFPPPAYKYYVTGHSLGGAISLQLMRDLPGKIEPNALLLNPAIQFVDLRNQREGVRTLYQSRDPLYKLEGHLWRDKTVLESPTNVGTLAAHKLDSFRANWPALFEGGARNAIGRSLLLKNAESKPFSDGDIRRLLPGISIKTYPPAVRRALPRRRPRPLRPRRHLVFNKQQDGRALGGHPRPRRRQDRRVL